jgi:hypothetical protein
MSELHPSYGAPFTPKSGTANPDNLLREIMQENPGASEKTTWPLFREAILKHDGIDAAGVYDMNDACLRYYHINARSRLEALMSDSKPEKPSEDEASEDEADGKANGKQKAADAKAEAEEKAKAKAEKIKRTFVLDTPMPNGKLLRDCTVKYACKLPGAFARLGKLLGKMGKPNQLVGEVISNKQADAAFKGLAK